MDAISVVGFLVSKVCFQTHVMSQLLWDDDDMMYCLTRRDRITSTQTERSIKSVSWEHWFMIYSCSKRHCGPIPSRSGARHTAKYPPQQRKQYKAFSIENVRWSLSFNELWARSKIKPVPPFRWPRDFSIVKRDNKFKMQIPYLGYGIWQTGQIVALQAIENGNSPLPLCHV